MNLKRLLIIKNIIIIEYIIKKKILLKIMNMKVIILLKTKIRAKILPTKVINLLKKIQ